MSTKILDKCQIFLLLVSWLCKMVRKTLFCVLVLVLALNVFGEDGMTYYVDSLNGSNANTGTSPSSPFETIGEAMQDGASKNYSPIIISLFPGTYNGTGNIQLRLADNTRITAYTESGRSGNPIINGNDRGNAVQCLMPIKDFQIDGITFDSCSRAIQINNTNADVQINSCSFYNSENVGINIDNVNSFEIHDSDFSDNTRASILIESAKDIVIDGCEFRTVGISVDESEHGEITNCHFEDILSEEGGSAIQVCKINKGDWEITGVDVYHAEITDTNSSADKAHGGAMSLTNGSFRIADSSFAECKAPDYGGTLYVAGADLEITNSTFINSTAEDYGGALYIVGSSARLDNLRFEDNQARYGGAINLSGNTTLDISDIVFHGNLANNGSCVACCGDDATGCESSLIESGEIKFEDNINNGGGVDITCTMMTPSSPTPVPSVSSGNSPDDGGLSTAWIIVIVLLSVGTGIVIFGAIGAGVAFYLKKRQDYQSL